MTIREAKDELIRISNNKEQREMYEMRAKILKDKVSALNEAERKGIEKGIQQGIEQGIQQGIQQGIIKMAKSLLDVLDDKTIAIKTGLDMEVVKRLREE